MQTTLSTTAKAPNRSRMEIIRDERVVFVVKHKKGRMFAIAFSTDTTDEKALSEARAAHPSEWGKIDTSSLRFV